jgi:integrase
MVRRGNDQLQRFPRAPMGPGKSEGSSDISIWLSHLRTYQAQGGSSLERAGLTLRDGQLTHVLRHTFASHFMMNGGNILVLQRALGHANLQRTRGHWLTCCCARAAARDYR